jgi:hypothetical protein
MYDSIKIVGKGRKQSPAEKLAIAPHVAPDERLCARYAGITVYRDDDAERPFMRWVAAITSDRQVLLVADKTLFRKYQVLALSYADLKPGVSEKYRTVGDLIVLGTREGRAYLLEMAGDAAITKALAVDLRSGIAGYRAIHLGIDPANLE